MLTRALACLLASLATLTAATMAAVAAWDRGGTALDRALLVALSVAIVAGVHLIPALTRRKVALLLWAGCLSGALFADLTFFVHANLRAGEAQARKSAAVTGTTRQIEAAREALQSITARPVAVLGAEFAITRSRRQRAALRLELDEAKRAEALRDGLITLQAAQTQAEVAGATDPVVARIAEVTGVTAASISLSVGLGFALLLELLGALLWVEALRPRQDQAETQEEPTGATAENPENPDDPLADLRAAIEAGKCKATVAGIRAWAGCSQSRAMEMRRALTEKEAA